MRTTYATINIGYIDSLIEESNICDGFASIAMKPQSPVSILI